MLPLLIIYKSDAELENYLKSFTKNNVISEHYIFHISPLKSEITIDQIRSIKKEVELIDTNVRLFIVHEFHTAGAEAQNAFLKTLEEKSNNNIFMLLTANEHLVLPTIKSRVKVIQLEKNASNNKEITESLAELITLLQKPSSYQFLSNPYSIVTTKEKALMLIDELIYYFRARIHDDQTITEIIKKALSTKSLLSSNNLNPQLAVDSLLIFINRTYTSLANAKKRSNN
jgi:hypothetical protein